MPPIWTEVTRDFVSLQQSKAYARVARALGLGQSAEKGYAALAVPPRPALRPLPDAVADQLGLTEDQRKQFDETAVRIDNEYRSLEIPTQFEDSTAYPSLAILFDSAYGMLRERGLTLDPTPLFATIALGDINARMMREPETKTPIIFFDHGLFRFLHGFSQATGWAIPRISQEQLASDEALASIGPMYTMPPQASESFMAVFNRFVFAGSARTTETVLNPMGNQLAAMSLSMLMEHFVMGHELAHIVLGHKQDVTDSAERWQQEFDADMVGATLTVAKSHDTFGSGGFGLWAADTVLVAFHLLERALAVAEHGDRKFEWISQTHPDPLTRRARLHQHPDIPAEMMLAAANLSAMSQAIFQRLWECLVPSLLLNHDSGLRPFITWKQHISNSFAAREEDS